MRLHIVLPILALLLGLHAAGQQAARMEAKGDLTLRDSPPSGLFYTMGAAKGVVKKGDTLVVQETKEVTTFFSKYIWYRVEVLDPNTEKRKGSGWIYGGTRGGESYVKQQGAKTALPKKK